MKPFKFAIIAIAVGACLSLRAVPILTSGSGDGAGQNLNNYFSAWGISLDVNTDQLAGDAYWNDKIPGGSSAIMVLEVAGHASNNTFGIFQVSGSTITRTEVFNGAAAAGASTSLAIPVGNFGFYLGYFGTYFYSDSSLNAGGADQMAAYHGPTAAATITTAVGNLAWDTQSYLIAWEDLPYASSDKDFNDLVLMVRTPATANNVPEGGSTVILVAAGLILMAVARSPVRALLSSHKAT